MRARLCLVTGEFRSRELDTSADLFRMAQATPHLYQKPSTPPATGEERKKLRLAMRAIGL